MLRWLEKPLVIDDAFAQCEAIVVLGAPLRGGRLTPILLIGIAISMLALSRHRRT